MMPSFRQKFVGFIRQLSNSSESARDNDAPDNTSDCFIQNYLKGTEKVNKNEPVILHGKKPYEIPPLNIGPYKSTEIKAADTGPDGGLVTVNKKEDPNANNTVAGVDNWENPHVRAYGQSCSLYEVHPVTQLRAGDPIADCFGVLVREDSAILCLADGVNWGVKASVAAKAAVHGCIDYLNTHLFHDASPRPSTTTEVFTILLRSFHAAHSLILQEKGMLTTLTASVVLPLDNTPGQYVVCTCNVGDSLAYVYSPKHGVREITQGSHDVHQMRDMRDALGALGPVDGQNPELSNLTLSLTQVETGDILFLTSDGVSDNLDPVVGKFTGLPTVEAHQRHRLLLLRTEDLLRYGVSGKGPSVSSAQDTVSLLLDFVTRLTGAKRHILEDRDLYTTGPDGNLMSPGEQASRRREICKRLHAIPGKLDHASVAAYVVGRVKLEREMEIEEETEEKKSSRAVETSSKQVTKDRTEVEFKEDEKSKESLDDEVMKKEMGKCDERREGELGSRQVVKEGNESNSESRRGNESIEKRLNKDSANDGDSLDYIDGETEYDERDREMLSKEIGSGHGDSTYQSDVKNNNRHSERDGEHLGDLKTSTCKIVPNERPVREVEHSRSTSNDGKSSGSNVKDETSTASNVKNGSTASNAKDRISSASNVKDRSSSRNHDKRGTRVKDNRSRRAKDSETKS